MNVKLFCNIYNEYNYVSIKGIDPEGPKDHHWVPPISVYPSGGYPMIAETSWIFLYIGCPSQMGKK